MTKEELLTSGELDFTVSKRKMLYEGTYDGTYNTPFFCTVNDKTAEALGPVRSRYTVLQNADLLDNILDKLQPNSYDLSQSKCGMFGGGKKIYFFIKLNSNIAIGQDGFDVYLYALSSHDGSQRLVYGVSTKTHSCQNMFATLMADKDNNYVVKHTAKIEKNNKMFINDLIDRNLMGIKHLFTIMQQHTPTPTFHNNFLDIVAKTAGKKKIVQSVKDKRNELSKSIALERENKGDTYYGLFNGLTHYLTHKHHEYTNWSPEYELLVGNSNSYTKEALKRIINEMRAQGISLN
tara:strand:- start:10203 stop:11078 length:876 start_codon:yes stop_codon:yes gene_type:complete